MQENGIGGLTLPLQLFGENRAPDRHLSRSVFCNDSLAIDDSHDALLVEMPARERQHEHPEVGARGQLCYPRATGQTKSFGFTVSKAQSIRSINLSAVLPMSSPGIPPRDTVPMTTSPGRRRAKLSRTA